MELRNALSAMGVHEMGFEFDFHGAEVVADDPFIDGDENGGMRWTFAPVAKRLAAINTRPQDGILNRTGQFPGERLSNESVSCWQEVWGLDCGH